MSWGISLSNISAATAIEQAKAEFEKLYKEPFVEVQEQFNRAIDALLLIIPSVAPAPDAIVTISCSGHANREHKKDPAWANDMVSVSVYQV